MLNKIKISFSLLIFVVIISCSETKKIIVHNCHNDIEAGSDILRSIDKNTDYLKQNNIKIRIAKNKCGYTLIYKKDKKFIQASMTDIDLMLEIKYFYNLKK